jgi:hypothetical protein
MRRLTATEWRDVAEAEIDDERAAVLDARRLADELRANARAYEGDEISYEEFSRAAYRAWGEADEAGLHAEVLKLVCPPMPAGGLKRRARA